MRPKEPRTQSDIDSLIAEGYRWIVVHPTRFSSDKVRAAHTHELESILGQPAELDNRWVWDLEQQQ